MMLDTHTTEAAMFKPEGYLVESIIRRGAWKVCVTFRDGRNGFLRGGHAWKTKSGAERALARYIQENTICGMRLN